MVIRGQVDGAIVDCGGFTQIAEAFLQIAENPKRLETMSQSSRKRIEDSFTIEQEARALVDVYESFFRSVPGDRLKGRRILARVRNTLNSLKTGS